MYKSFIFTITVAFLSSVAYGKVEECGEDAKLACDEFCKPTLGINSSVACVDSNGSRCATTPLKLVSSYKDGRCNTEFNDACSTFTIKVPKGFCFCVAGERQQCKQYEQGR